ncbi:16S rRNA (cytidine(1402)-2'-O)-methyltransferase [Streptococcus gallolyticus subsp. gallolyticus]|uniref:Ribosomal RNA small subunit methyltransferase I n=1 Tax=Streptococcus gallolyticus (strain UCN34) TaxID=637909 RepID=A0AA36NNH1_STRG3|nr:16S rRNA (cytidine(1402)-2'-O)-methyltransferase [Streptococcus gallolyticus]EFM29005.1 S-adenosylmethionine-dependent methyltransferase, YraL family [Streptococcus gallolyticus subsp. gallolyticus TX20005]KJE99442.1 16S rRNA methyltransferase [Streptococcus gallolyticus subsp. gallolyticus]MCF0239482.1 16S rRNA (cytidine(1402)-2'-O)-methyltransferase [Streptococcus gallolyticus]MCF1634952.1 16S rRNA (cytidine(1402)-2'-O)-methyltransferase [Streptococcus gallolyticus]MCY7151185.1 16S rRNA (
MKVQKSFKNQTTYGKLYLVPTPIGNMQDMTYRAVEMLKNADFVCAEDTRNTGLLLKHFDISAKQISFHEHNAYEKIPELIALMKEGKILAQVSDAGMPSISDPGHDLVKAAIAEEIPVVAIPGASAGITALIASGLAPQPHIFYGFLPRKAKQQKEFFEAKKQYPETQIFYESPYRVADTLDNMLAVYGDRKIVLVRELTKLYEEYQRGYISEILEYIAQNPLKGECLIVVSGQDETVTSEEMPEDVNPAELVAQLVEAGDKPNQAIKKIAKTYGLNRQEVYNAYHQL